MTWEETIQYIRTLPEYEDLVEKAYFEEDLLLNVERFGESEEFKKTLEIIKREQPQGKKILDVGSGNGMSAINFALKGFGVIALEPDTSKTIGAGAIRKLKEELSLETIEIIEDFAENIKFNDATFDIVYVRQAMHHANNLNKFIAECVRVLKSGGILLTIRDHVVYDEKDKLWFLENHPLHKFYGGENAYTRQEYVNAIEKAGATILKELKHFDSVINYFPITERELEATRLNNIANKKISLKNKLGIISNLPFIWHMYTIIGNYIPLDEKIVPGRMYSYIAQKK